jgi:molybdopterin synthase sulfur carrier subunit
VKVLYFAWLRQKTGVAQEDIDVPASVSTVAALMDFLAARSPAHADAFAERASIRCAVNQDFAKPDARVAANDEVAFFPPVTGG